VRAGGGSGGCDKQFITVQATGLRLQMEWLRWGSVHVREPRASKRTFLWGRGEEKLWGQFGRVGHSVRIAVSSMLFNILT